MKTFVKGRHRGFPAPFRDDAGTPSEILGHRGGRRERRFEPGHIKLLTLHILAEEARHGYEVIRTISDLVGGEYSPSPGTIYPTLTLLEDKGLVAAVQLENGRRQYDITEEGKAEIAEHRALLDELLAHLSIGRSHAKARRAPEIQRAMENLKTALRLYFEDGAPDTEIVRRMAEIIDRAAVDIGRIR